MTMPCEPPDASASRRQPIVVAPGVYDALTALIAEQAGFETLYVSGAAIAYTRLGRPDIGLVGMSEVAETVALIRDRVGAAPDRRCRHRLRQCAQRRSARCGCSSAPAPTPSSSRTRTSPSAAAISTARRSFPPPRWCGKIKAAVDARRSRETLIIARTDAVAVEGFEPRLERAAALPRGRRRRAVRRGAARRASELARIAAALRHRRAAAGQHGRGRQDAAPAGAGARGARLRARHLPRRRSCARWPARPSEFYAALAAHGTTEPFRDRMFDFDALNELIGTPEMLALGERYRRAWAQARGGRR